MLDLRVASHPRWLAVSGPVRACALASLQIDDELVPGHNVHASEMILRGNCRRRSSTALMHFASNTQDTKHNSSFDPASSQLAQLSALTHYVSAYVALKS